MKTVSSILLLFLLFASCSSGENAPATQSGTETTVTDAPKITVNRNSKSLSSGTSEINLGTVLSGSSGNNAEVIISNSGTVDLVIHEIQITGSDPNDFSSNFDSEAAIPPGESTTVVISFSPATTTTGGRSADLRIRHNDESSENPFSLMLTGSVTTTIPDISVTDTDNNLVINGTSETNYGVINEDTTTAYKTFTIQNRGSAELTIDSLTVSSSQFDIDQSSLNGTLAVYGQAGSSTTFRIRFAPDNPGFFSETVTIGSNDPDESSYTFTVSGTALNTNTTIRPRIMVKVDNTGITSGSTIDFGSLRVNPLNTPNSETKTITIYNVGSAPLNLNSINTITGDYTRTNPGSATLAPGGSTSLTVTYDPDDRLAPTPHTRTLIIANDDPLNSSYTLHLTGLAYDPVMSITNSGTNMGNNASQQTLNPTTSSKTVTISNTGNYDLVIQNITATGDFTHFSDTRSGAIGTIAAGGSLQFTVTHEPDTDVDVSQSITYTIEGTDPANLSDTITFNAESRVPNINTTTDTLSFGSPVSIDLGSSATSEVTILNSGTAPAELEVTGITIGGTNASDFSFDTLTLPITIGPGGSNSSSVLRFTPASPYSPGSRTATLTVASDDPDTPAFTIDVTGIITEPVITANITPVFPEAALGDSEQITLTLTNSSESDAQITGVSINPSSGNAGEFAITNAPAYPLTLSKGSPNSDIIITFSPVEQSTDALDIANRSLVLTVDHDTGPTDFPFSGITVAYPMISLSPTSLNFGNTLVGSTSDRVLTVTNIGSAPLTITPSITIGTGEYLILSAPLAPIAAGDTAAITVRYTAAGTTDNATQAGTLNIVTNDYLTAQKSINVDLTGVAQYEATCDVTPASINFGAIETGTSSSANIVTISNNGKGDLTIDSITSSNANFLVSAFSPSAIPEGGSGTFSVTYSPTAAGAHTGTITIVNSDEGNSNGDVTISLSGSAVAPVIGASISFAGFTPIGDTLSADLEITNGAASVADLVISSVTLSNNTDFEINYTSSLPISIGPGASNNTIKIIFKPQPTYTATKTTVITIVSNDPNDNPHVITPVDATVEAPDITSGDDISGAVFSDTAVGTTSATESFTYTNDGPGTLTISSITLTGTNAADFTIVSNPAPVSVLNGSTATATVNVTFSPSATGTRRANISFASDDPDTPANYEITGTGIQEAVGTIALVGTIPLTAVDSVSAGTALSIQNSGNSTLTVYSVISTGTNASDFYATGPFPITIGASLTNSTDISVFFKPTALGMRETDLEIYSSAPGSPHSITISANANAIIDNKMAGDSLNTGKYSSIDISGTNIYISYYDETNQRLKTAVSNDYGNTFFVSAADPAIGRGKYSQIKADGTDVFIAYYDELAKNLLFISSIDGGASWGTTVVVDGVGSDCGEHISMARNGANLYISYYDNTHDMVKLAHSADSGASWDVYLVDKTTCAGTSVAVSGTTVHLAYYAENSYASLFSIDAPSGEYDLSGSDHDFNLEIDGTTENIILPDNASTTIDFIVGRINTAFTPAIKAYNYNGRRAAVFEQTAGDTNGIEINNGVETSVNGILFATVPTTVADGNALIQELRYAKSTSLHTWDIQSIENGGYGLAPSLAVDGNDLGVSYVTDDTTGTIRYASSGDSGATWIVIGDLFSPGSSSGYYFGSLSFDGSGSALFAFYDENNDILMFTKGGYDGTNLDAGSIVIDSNTGRGTFPAMAISGSDLFIIYFDDNDDDIIIIKSEDIGDTW